MIPVTAISLYENFVGLCSDTCNFKFLCIQSISVYVSWDTGGFNFLCMQSISVHVSWDTGNFNFLCMQSISVHMSWCTGNFKFLYMQSISLHVNWDAGDYNFLCMQSIYPCIFNVTDFNYIKRSEYKPNVSYHDCYILSLPVSSYLSNLIKKFLPQFIILFITQWLNKMPKTAYYSCDLWR